MNKQHALDAGFPAHVAAQLEAAGVTPDHNVWTVIQAVWAKVGPAVQPLLVSLIQQLLSGIGKPPAPPTP